MNLLLIILVLLIIAILIISNYPKEPFDIPLRSSSAWGWNTGPGYGAGYGTGYAMWGVWPANLNKEPWKNWMWARRPRVFKSAFTPVPQIDYNDAVDQDGKPVSNYMISIVPMNGRAALTINGQVEPTLQLDRNRVYYFHVYTPGASFTINSNGKPLFKPVSNETIKLRFDETDNDQLTYGNSQSNGTIYLNSTRWN